MANVNFEEEFIVALLHNPVSLYSRAKRAQLSGDFFQDTSLKKIYLVISKMVEEKSEITESSVVTAIALDRSIEVADRTILRNMVSELYEEEPKHSEFSFNVLKARAKGRVFTDALQNTMRSMVEESASNPDKYIESMYESMRKLRDDKIEINVTLYNSFDSWEKRKEARLQAHLHLGNAIQMTGNLSEFDKVFKRGFEPATITVFGGNTGVGKSLMLLNVAKEAISPRNKLNGLFVIAENREIESTSRLDAVLLDREYNKLWPVEEISDPKGDLAFASMEDWGKLYAVKFQVGHFNADDIRSVFEDYFKVNGVEPQFLIIDSPDHMTPIKWSPKTNERKGEVYLDLKNICDDYNIPVIASLPMQASAAKKKTLSAEDGAGSYDIVKIADNAVFFAASDEDELLNRRTLYVVKSRGGAGSKEPFYFKLKTSLILEPWDENKIGNWKMKDIQISDGNDKTHPEDIFSDFDYDEDEDED
jgi:hypothetical protein